MEQFKRKFIEEAIDLINELETTLLTLEKSPLDKALIEQIFRAMHSLKGGSSMFGFTKMDKFTHHLESMYDLVRNNKLHISPELFDITYTAIDHLKKLAATGEEQNEKFNLENEQLIQRIVRIISNNTKTPSNIVNTIEHVQNPFTIGTEQAVTYYIYFQPNEDLLKTGSNPLFIVDEISHLGKCIVFPRTNRIPDIEMLDTSKCFIYWEIFIATSIDITALQDVFIFVENKCSITIEKISEDNLIENVDFIEKIDVLLQKCSQFEIPAIKQIINTLQQTKKIEQFSLSLKSKKQNISKENHQISSIRVSSDKLDMLMNYVSELVTTQARLSLFAEHNNSAELTAIAENIEKISRNLRDNAFSICLIPLDSVLTRFQRLVRDLSAELNKEVAFVIEGAETELDKTIVENITDPIMHILRNSLDHGIEDAKERKRLKKPIQGKILLKAFYSGANVIIKIQDDGAGIDINNIKNKAISKGLISKDAVLSRRDVFDLLFLPGFTTATKVSDVSGRGVGMDVVKRKITELRGEVEISSELGKGTSITIKLPLTLSIIDGLLVKIAGIQFIIPLSVVLRIFAVKHTTIEKAFNNFIVLDEMRYPFYYLRNEFEINIDKSTAMEQIVLVNYEGASIGLAVDSIIGQYQAVLKPLGKLYKHQELISGASILGDGTIALVFDTNKIIKRFSKEK